MHRPLLVAVAVACGAVFLLLVGVREYRKSHSGLLALQEAWEEVRRDPHDAAAWAALGDAQAAAEQLIAAEGAYRTARRLGSSDPSLPARLGFLLYGQGQDEEALELLEEARRGGATLPLLERTLAELRQSTARPLAASARAAAPARTPAADPGRDDAGCAPSRACRPPSPQPAAEPPDAAGEAAEPPAARQRAAREPASCAVPLARAGQRGTFLVAVQLEGAAARLVVDTGASITALSRELLEQLRVTIDEEHQLQAFTANGQVSFATAVLSSLVVAGREVSDLRVAVCDQCGGPDADGLLGLDAQAALGVELELRGSQLRLLDCD